MKTSSCKKLLRRSQTASRSQPLYATPFASTSNVNMHVVFYVVFFFFFFNNIITKTIGKCNR